MFARYRSAQRSLDLTQSDVMSLSIRNKPHQPTTRHEHSPPPNGKVAVSLRRHIYAFTMAPCGVLLENTVPVGAGSDARKGELVIFMSLGGHIKNGAEFFPSPKFEVCGANIHIGRISISNKYCGHTIKKAML